MSNDYNTIRRKLYSKYFPIPFLPKKMKKVYIINCI